MSEKVQEYYKIGEIVNSLPYSFQSIPQHASCYVKVASRLDTFLCHHNYFVEPPRTQVYPVDSINFAINQFTEAKVECIDGGEIHIDDSVDRKDILRHTALILKKTLGFTCGLKITGRNLHDIQHGGLGSSASLQTAVAVAINNIFGNKIPERDLVRFLAQNYGEECDRPGYLAPMASIGGASAVAMGKANLVVMGGEGEVWKRYNLSDEYSVFIITPDLGSEKISGAADMQMYKNGREAFLEMGREWGPIKENLLSTKIINGLNNDDTKPLFNLINMYTIGAYGDIPQYFKNRWLSHTVYFDEFIYDIFDDCFQGIDRKDSCFFVSSGGPAICFITKEDDTVLEKLKKYSYFTISKSKLYSNGPEIVLE